MYEEHFIKCYNYKSFTIYKLESEKCLKSVFQLQVGKQVGILLHGAQQGYFFHPEAGFMLFTQKAVLTKRWQILLLIAYLC